MRESECGIRAVECILRMIERGSLILPGEVSLRHLEKETGCRAQSLGSCFDHGIKRPLKAKGILAKKVGTPRVIQLKRSNRSKP